jgi:hypothetical protein
MGMGLPLVGEGCCRMLMGEEGLPHGVSTSRVAASSKPGSEEMPVPPMTAMWTGAVGELSSGRDGHETESAHHRRCWGHLPFCDMELRCVGRRYEV